MLLAVIGPNWLDAKDEDGNRRLDSESDFVRIEIAAALKRGIPVIPILLEGTRIPKPERLPDDVKDLPRRNGLSVHHASFHSDMDKLVRALRVIIAPPGPTEVTDKFNPTLRGLSIQQPPLPLEDSRQVRTTGSAQPATIAREVEPRADDRIKIDASIYHGAPDGWFKPGAGKSEWFKDHDAGPEMVVVPAGEFTMGTSASEIAALKKVYGQEGYDWEGPQRTVTIKLPFAVGRFAVTFDEWDACVADGGCNGYSPSDQDWGRGKRPVINVNFDDAMAYVEWLSRKTGKTYRLLSEAQHKYVTRAGTATAFWWGETISTAQANYNGNYTFRGGAKGQFRQKTVPVDSFEPNPWGLCNVHGNVWEWVEDVWHANYKGAPTDGSAWLQGGDPSERVVCGGSWRSGPQNLRAASRLRSDSVDRDGNLGFRVGRTLASETLLL